jgi:translocation and assembly module TamB
VDTFGRGETTLGLANLAGSALLGSVQDRVGQVLGLSEFRLFPTTAISEKGRGSTLGLGAEASIDVTEDLSVSMLKLLTTEQPGQFGLRYRVSPQTIIRGSTDFAGDSRGGVEYNIRF